MNNQELKDLEKEVEDAQFAFDADWKNLTDAIKFIQSSYQYLNEVKAKLKESNEK